MTKRIFVALALLISGLAMAQEGTTSPYSFFGIGELKFRGTVENRSMGGLSVFSDSIHVSIQNPAHLAGLSLVNYSVSGSHRTESLQNATDKQRASTTTLDYVAVGIPMGKFGASFGLLPFTAVGYQLESAIDGGVNQLSGSGGLNKAYLSLGYQVMDGLTVGATANYGFGTIENSSVVLLDDLQFGSREITTSELGGFGFNFGAAYKTMVSENLELSTSIVYTPENDIESNNSREISTIAVLPDGTQVAIDPREIDVARSDLSLPSQLTIGAGIGQPKKWYFGGEYSSEKTSNFANGDLQIPDVIYQDASKFRFGGYYIPNYNGFGSYWKRVVYRAGVRFEETGINVRGQDINEFGISFGVGLPVGKLFSNVNIGFEYGTRGTTDFGLVKENFFNTFISLSLNDRWFRKRYFD